MIRTVAPPPPALAQVSKHYSVSGASSLHDSGRTTPTPEPDLFHQLIADINDILGPCNGIDSAGIDVKEIENLMSNYRSSEPEWSRYAFADHTRAYTRNVLPPLPGIGKTKL